MKFHLIAAVLSCALLSLSYANVIETEQSLSQLEEETHNVDKQITAVEEPLQVASPEVQKVLQQIPQLIQAVANEQLPDDGIEEVDNNTEAVDVPQEIKAIAAPQQVNTDGVAVSQGDELAPLSNTRKAKQLIGFIPTYVLRQAIRMAQEQQGNDVRSLKYNNDEDDESNEIEEERAIRRRKRFRRRNSKNHLKKSRRHRNTNKRKINNHSNLNTNKSSKKKVSNQRESIKRRKTLKKPQKKKRKTNKRQEY